MECSLAQVQDVTGALLSGPHANLDDLRVSGWSIDSRTINQGDLFFAIRGEHLDGNAFAAAALERGAVAAIVNEPVCFNNAPVLLVRDTLEALQTMAHWARRAWGRPVVAITGSAGKTSTKEIVAAILGVRFRVGKTAGNFNNHVGLPLTLLRIPKDAEIGVVEIGMNHAGEIRHLCQIAEPRIGVVTNIGYAHIEFFDSIEGVAAAKRELVESLPPGGTAILNADDQRVLAFKTVHTGSSITYGVSPHADIRADNLELHSAGAAFTVAGVRFQTKLTGRHSVSNILAGLAVATVFGISLNDVTGLVAQLSPGKMRGERHVWQGVTVLNDSYNSNPEAVRSMLDVLRDEPARRRIAVLGEMLELGHMAEKLHREVGAYAAHSGVDVLIGVRGASRFLVDEGKRAGLADSAALFFDDPESAGEFLHRFVCPGDALLFKGSRGTHVELAVAGMEG
jgi:UDP-N-acetylmuramoyl-tripeptide--D-alanyl-D-alanine ligase